MGARKRSMQWTMCNTHARNPPSLFPSLTHPLTPPYFPSLSPIHSLPRSLLLPTPPSLPPSLPFSPPSLPLFLTPPSSLLPSFSPSPLPVVLIHWTRQIKELLTSQGSLETSTSSGPLEEIEFWRARCEDFSGLTKQLDQPGVHRVVMILQKAKSSYLGPFRKLSQQIQVCIIMLMNKS